MLVWFNNLDARRRLDAPSGTSVEAAASKYLGNGLSTALLYFVPCVMRVAGIVVLGCGLYASAVYHRRDEFYQSYVVSLLTWLCWALIDLSSDGVHVVRLCTERKLDRYLVGLHRRRVGKYLRIAAIALSFPGLLASVALACFAIYAICFSKSLGWQKSLVILGVTWEMVAGVIGICWDLGERLGSGLVLRAEEISWKITGLLLRPFEGEDTVLGRSSLSGIIQHKIERFLTQSILSSSGEPLRWLTVLRPGQRLVTPGIQRVALSDESWQFWIHSAISDAELIVMLIGSAGSLNWELRHVVTCGRIDDLRIIVFPGHSVNVRRQFFETLHSIAGLPTPSLPKSEHQSVAPFGGGPEYCAKSQFNQSQGLGNCHCGNQRSLRPVNTRTAPDGVVATACARTSYDSIR